jgi:hypothetical protein
MYRAATSIHDAVVLAATCHELGLPPPTPGPLRLGGATVSGFVLRLPGLRFPIACDTVTGLVAYHPADNVPGPYAQLMGFVAAYYVVRSRRHYVADEAQRSRRCPIREAS